MKNKTKTTKRKYQLWVNVVSVAIPIVVALLFKVRLPNVEPLSFLPPIYASINGLTALLLVSALIAIKNNKRRLHEGLMKTAIACSLLFLVMYVAYHMTSDPTSYEGPVATLYFSILISHILLSIIVIPLVLISYVRAFLGEYESHKKIVKFAYPIWLYVAVTGVIVYIMISPYYV
jgi:putative membrane protein|tara:strand:- start:1405 stop:1932 length:528 start_codon:yes stop_codon:yes gene_type:complete